MFPIGITDHVEDSRERPSADVFAEVADLVELADELGVRYAWFAEHHAYAHYGHLPTPLLLALHLAGRTRAIHLGAAIVCLNLHHPLDVAEQVAVADVLSGGRMAIGFGSGSTPEEHAFFGQAEQSEARRHERFAEALAIMQSAWSGAGTPAALRQYAIPPHRPLPVPAADLAGRCWVAVNSVGSAQIAGSLNFNMLFSHLRTPEQYGLFAAAYRAAGGTRLIAANRPVFVGETDERAFAMAEPALRILWRRFRDEGKIPAGTPEPASPADLCGHPLNFLVGSPATVARKWIELHREVPFDVANVEVRWAGLPHAAVRESLGRLMNEVAPVMAREIGGTRGSHRGGTEGHR